MFTFICCVAILLVCGYALNADVTVDWTNVIAVSKTTTTLQVVVNALLTRESPIHDQVFKSLGDLDANFVRFVPWFPYPRLGVAQLEPASGQYLCGHLNGDSNINNWTVSLSCPGTSTINDIQFASWGTPTGTCGKFVVGKCNAANSMNISRAYCLNKNSCTIPVNVDAFGGDPCHETVKQFDIQATCSEAYNYSNWNFTLLDPLMQDFMNSVNPKNEKNKTVINFSTIPNWKWAGVNYGSGLTDNPFDCSWGYNEGKALTDPTAKEVGEYYGRLVSWYTNGGFTDEYGNVYKSDFNYVIDTWEILNEMEHGLSPQLYTILYDAIVSGIWEYADPKHEMKFMGLAMGSHKQWEYYEYFLNISNHASADIPLDYLSFHFYASCSSRTDPISYQSFFPAVDNFILEVQNITKIRDALSPKTKLDIDEIGVILPGDNSDSPNPPDIYWNAAAAMFAYLFPQLVVEGVDIIGQSQLMGYPPIPETQFPASPGGLDPQFASVTEIDWETGVGNARYWLLKLLIENFEIGDKLVKTTFTETSSFYAQGFVSNNGEEDKKILIVNKVNQNVSVSFNGVNGGKLYVIDQQSGNGPAYIYDMQGNTFNMLPYGVAVLYPS